MRHRGNYPAKPWLVIVPVKPLRVAKSRLRGAVPDAVHPELVLAMASDTVAAAVGCAAVARVVVVGGDAALRHALARLGAECLPDPPGAGLNSALEHAAGRYRDQAVAALTADLPALRPEQLALALAEAARLTGRGYAPDALGTGTVLLTSTAGAALRPMFGPGSAAAHRDSGAHRLTGDWPTLRRDVDTPADLAAAARLGLGPHTRATLTAPPEHTASTRCHSVDPCEVGR